VRIVLKAAGVTHDEGMPSATVALSNVTVSVAQGECLAIIGPTGSGKTTLLEVMAGLTSPGIGIARIEPPGERTRLRETVGLAYQFPELQFFEETVFEDVAFGPVRQGIPEDDIPERVASALARSGLSPDEFADRAPLTLSAGEKRRAAIAGILALNRPFLLLDEPTAGLDPLTASGVEKMMVSEAESGNGVVFVTHDLELVERAASRAVVMLEGRIIADRTVEEVMCDGEMLRRAGLEPPPRHVLIERLRGLAWPDVERLAGLLATGRPEC
jgi:energy-coupling factor transport system ATP-binding protein